MASSNCPNCGRPTAAGNNYAERHDQAYCSPVTSPDCWEWPDPDTALIHYDVGYSGPRAACGKRRGDVWTSNEGDVNCPDCLAVM
jgi:hypothetical protein